MRLCVHFIYSQTYDGAHMFSVQTGIRKEFSLFFPRSSKQNIMMMADDYLEQKTHSSFHTKPRKRENFK